MPETAAPPAPAAAAPAAAPATAAPAAPSAPATPPPHDAGPGLVDAFAQLEKFADKPATEAKSQAQRAADAKAATPPDDKADDAAPDPVKAGEQAPAKPADKPVGPRQLAQAYEALKAKFKTADEELTQLKASAKPLDMKNHPEMVKLTERLREVEKQRDALDEEIKFTKYERSDEYKEKYWKPFETAYGEGEAWVAQLQITDAEGTARKATPEDFGRVLQQYFQNPMEGQRLINEMFGEHAAGVVWHAKEIGQLNAAKNRALEQKRKDGGEWEKQRSEQMTAAQTAAKDLYHREVQAGLERFPQWFKPADGDAEGSAVLSKGMELADAAFGGTLKDPKTGKEISLTPEMKVKLHAALRNKAGGFDYIVHKAKQLEGKVTELENKLKAYEESEPGPGERKNPPGEPTNLWDKIDRDLAGRAR